MVRNRDGMRMVPSRATRFSSAMLPAAPDEWTIQEAAHLLRRAGFGGSPKEIESFHALGRYRAVESLLVPTEPVDAFALPAWANREQAVADMKARFEQFQEVRRATRELPAEEAEKVRREYQQKQQRTNRQHGIEAQPPGRRRARASLFGATGHRGVPP